MATRKIVYDDQDSTAIHYTGGWFQEIGTQGSSGNYGTPYLHTLHGTHHDATISFEFDGTGVAVYGTNNLSNPKTDPDPNLECFIDGVSIGREPPFEFPENNWKLCGTTGLPTGQHKLHIGIKVKSIEQTFWLDRIEYIPSSSVPLDNKIIKLTNTDPAIQLDDSWDSFAVFKGTAKENAVAHVDFIGTSVSWIGYIPSDLPHGSALGTYSIDDGKPTEFNLVGLPENARNSEYNQIFFTTPEVKNGPHTLTVTFLGSGGTTPLTLDFLLIKNGSLTAVSSSSSPNINPSTISTPNAATSSGSVNDGRESPAGLNIGALLGGILGGLGCFILIAGALLYRRQRRLSRENVVQVFYSDGGLPTIIDHNGTPNLMAQPTYGGVALPVNQLSAKRREAIRVEAQPKDRFYSRQHIVVPEARDNSGMVHTDSGIRLNQQLQDEIPPHYTLE